MKLQLHIPRKVQMILQAIEQAGFEAYAVGGCVRDSILGRNPHDWDVTTSAYPEDVKKIFHKTIDTGLQHGTVTVMIEKEGFEVTTYRVDGEYEDGRHPKEVSFTASLEEDLKRRDFTINAMAYNPTVGLVDLFGGMEDIENKTIRCVGNPLERFTEDALRILRAIRFSAQLGFEVEESTYKALGVLAPNLKKVSAERIQAELVKIMESPNPDYMRMAYHAGITREFLPEFDICMETAQNNINHCFTVGEHILHSMKYIRANKAMRLTMLFHDIGKPEKKTTDEAGIDHFKGHAEKSVEKAVQIMKRLKFDNETIDTVKILVKWHDERTQAIEKEVRWAVYKIEEKYFPMLLEVQYADSMAQSEYHREEKLKRISTVKELYNKIIEEKQCVSLKMLAITGNDLIQAGMKPGKEIGEMLQSMMEYVLEDPARNTREELISFFKRSKGIS